MTSDPIDAATKISITLAAAEWNQILGVLGEAPYRVVAPLIGQIVEQATQAAQTTQPSNGADPNGADPNGADRGHSPGSPTPTDAPA